ncbi:hypothetical protein [Tepidimonas sp.]|uniref:hypothetical protein n=1 Tax=Tepidimonas sp. TaxID=2002775 RepID=UPI00391A5BA8
MITFASSLMSEPSPDFKGIKTRQFRRPFGRCRSEPSPDFKGIKTSRASSSVPFWFTSEPSPDFKGIKTS